MQAPLDLGRNAVAAALAIAASVGIAVAGATPAVADTAPTGTAPTGIAFLTAAPAAAVVGGSYAVRVRGDGATTAVELYTQDDSVCSVASLVVTFAAEGTCLVEAHQDADGSHAEADSAQLVDIEAAAAAPAAAAPVTAKPAPVKTDRVAPRITIEGVRAGAAYRGAGPRARCQARDTVSGVVHCSLTSTRRGHVVTVRARASDRAGNQSRLVLRYRVHVR